MKKNIIVVVTILLTLLLLSGCVDSNVPPIPFEPDESESQNNKQLFIAYAVSNFENEFYRQFVSYMEEYCEELGIRLTYKDGESDVTKQIYAIEEWIQQGVDAVICAPVDPVAMQSTADTCMNLGIPFINTDAECENKTSYIGVVQHDYGYMAGKIAAEWLNDNQPDKDIIECAILTKPQSFAVIERANGIIDGLVENCARARIVAQVPYTTVKEAREAIGKVIGDHPAIQCVISVAGTGIIGAYQAFLATGKNTDNICLVGIDATDTVLEKIAENTMIRGTVDQNIRYYARTSIDLAVKAIEGDPVERINLKISEVTAKNIKDYIDIGTTE
ncbi:MAG: sugar ABC transporter substrate-binding protein [Clostridiales bacterium]|nr:sugar ABC transporter substrate-binding protein [Clostridiales bacterium]